MRTQLGSGGSSKDYLFKDGTLRHGVTLGTGLNITNNIIYTNASGGTAWKIPYHIDQGKYFGVKLTCTADAGSTGNEAYISVNAGGKTGVTRFAGENENNGVIMFSLEMFSSTESIILYIYTYARAMGIMEMWIE